MSQKPSAELTAGFEDDLYSLVASAYGRGVRIEGTWELAVPVSDAPNWTVTIERDEPDDESSYEPELLEE